MNKSLHTKDYDYELPQSLIAQHPAERRDTSRLMVVDRKSGAVGHRLFSDVTDYITPRDLLVLNNTRVFPARLTGRLPTGGAFEVLLVRRLEESGCRWQALVRPGRKLKPGRALEVGDGSLRVYIEESGDAGERCVRLEAADKAHDPGSLIERLGHMPLPPYIDRPDTGEDRERYQTVYASVTGAVAAPTAGLHFTPELMEAVRDKGAGFAELTLHVGPGTFRPVTAETLAEHEMEEEYYIVDSPALARISSARAQGAKIIAVGTTTVRTLETLASGEESLDELDRGFPRIGWTRLFIYPGHRFHLVDMLLTNFHLPRSTLLMLVSAFAGKELIDRAYREAVREKYRFYSYGDAMLII